MNRILNIAGISLALTLMFSSCNKERVAGRNLKNTMWKIVTLEEKPISNEFGPIQCAIDTVKINSGGLTFRETSGNAAFQYASDSSKVRGEFVWQVVESEDPEKSELHLETSSFPGFPIHFIIDPLETRSDNMTLYYEKVNPCGDLVRYTFTLEKFDYAQ